ncbi:fibrinogen alpha chain [Cetorhinus maximus]
MRAVLALGLTPCFINLVLASVLMPRGPRPIENRDRSKSKLCSEDEWSICTQDDWGPKCPSGCRMQGLIETQDQQNVDRIKGIQLMLEMYSTSFGNTHITVTEAINRIRQTLNGIGGQGNTYNELVNHLNTRLAILQSRVNEQINKLSMLKNSILVQFTEISRLEVDIDIKLRACKGSCEQAFVYNIDRERNAQIEKNLKLMTSASLETARYGKPTRIFKMRQLKEPLVNTNYKSAAVKGSHDETDKLYPHFWEELSSDIFTLEPNTKDSSVHETSGVISSKLVGDSKGTSVTFSGGKVITAGQVGSKTKSDESMHGYEHHFSERLHLHGKLNLTKGLGFDSEFDTHFTNTSEAIRTRIPDPDSLGTLLEHLGINLNGKTKGSVTTVVKTSNLRHISGGTKSAGSKTSHSMIDTNNGDPLTAYQNLGKYRDFSNLDHGQPIGGTDDVSNSRKTVLHERMIVHWPHDGGSKGGTHNPAHLPDDETGASDPSAHMFHSEG